MKKQKTGRPEAVIDERQFTAMCQLQCTESEICSVLGVTEKTLAKWCESTYGMRFSQIFKIKREGGKVSLRRMQWKNAEGGNTSMLIWLGKQYLGQRDKFPEEEEDRIAQPINITLMPYDASKPDSPSDSTPG